MIALLAKINYNDLISMAIPVIVVSFSMAIPIVSIITERFQKRDRMRLIEKAIEHGANLEDLQLEDPETPPRLPYRNGMVSVAVGTALVLGHLLLRPTLEAHGTGELALIMLLGGLIVGCVGIALLINDRMNRDKFDTPA